MLQKNVTSRTGEKVTFHKNFVKIGKTIVTNEEIAKIYKQLA